MDRAVRALFEPARAPEVALAAVGGYGRRELAPGSDIDLLFLHAGGDEGAMRPIVDAVLYPLWDAGMRVSHAVRTPEECLAQSRKGLPTLTAILDARPVGGGAELVDLARGGATGLAGAEPDLFVAALLAEQIDREQRFGSVWRTLQPDLKMGVGGLRDLQLVRWVLAMKATAGTPEHLEPALDLFLRARTALHLVGDRATNRLVAEQQRAVAHRLGYVDQDGWEAADALMRDLFAWARRVHAATLDLALVESGPPPANSLEDFLQGSVSDPPSLRHPLATESVESLPGLRSAWSRVKGRPQRDPYHRYPVDVHLLEAVGEAVALVRGTDEPFDAEAVRSLEEPASLLLGALLHDIGKVGTGSHIPTGTDIARDVLDGMGTSTGFREDVLFLVREHLLLADTATRRNLEEEDLILQVAAHIGDRRRLAMLYLLTVADAAATGPAASTPWRMTLIRDLVAKLDHVFERGVMDEDRAGRLAAATLAIRATMARGGASAEAVEGLIARVPPDYVLWADPEEAPAHQGLIVPPPGPNEVRTDVRPGRSPGTYRVAVGAVDRLGLLAAVAGSFTLAGLSILSARAFTTEDGIALDVFEVRGAFEAVVDEQRWGRFRAALRDATGPTDLAGRIGSLRSHYRPVETNVPVTVRVDQDVSDFSTVVEVGGPDRLGLLFDLARTFSDHGLDVHVAKVATYGPRVVDVFYVRREQGGKVDDPDQAAELVRALTEAASGG